MLSKEVSKQDCIIMGDFNHGHIQWTSLQSTGREDQEFLNLVQDSFLSQHVVRSNQGRERVRHSIELTEGIC